MATFLRILRGQTTDLIGKNHPLEFTRSVARMHFHPRIFTHAFSPTHFYPPVFTKKVDEKCNSYTMIKSKCPFSPTFFKKWVKMALSYIKWAKTQKAFLHMNSSSSSNHVARRVSHPHRETIGLEGGVSSLGVDCQNYGGGVVK